jgi:hypothetical protein
MIENIIQTSSGYRATIGPAIAYLQGRDSTLAYRIAARGRKRRRAGGHLKPQPSQQQQPQSPFGDAIPRHIPWPRAIGPRARTSNGLRFACAPS